MHRRAFVLTGSAAALAAGPTAAGPATFEKLAHVRTVGVISTIGQAFILQFIGVMRFSNKEKPLPIDDWRIDEHIEARLKSELGGRFTFKPIEYDPRLFALPKSSIGLISRPTATRAVKDLPDQGVDAFILVTPSWRTDGRFYISALCGGLGIYRLNTGHVEASVIHAFYQVTVVDAKTRKVLAQRLAEIPEKASFGYAAPARELAPWAWEDDPETMMPRRKAHLRAELLSLLDASLDFTLERMGVTAGTPAD